MARKYRTARRHLAGFNKNRWFLAVVATRSLTESELIVNHKLVASIMKELQLHGLPTRRARRRNLIAVRTVSELVKRNFTATRPNQLSSVSTTTGIQAEEGRVFACVVLDVFSWKAVGWAVGWAADTAFVNSAGAKAVISD